MKLVYECPSCNKEFTKTAKGLSGPSSPVKCPHCGEISLLQWKRLVTEDNASTLSK
jgi:DNA-directed RNA polymerase subunit RPC12/RpoP